MSYVYETNDYELLKEGEYEVVIEKIEKRTTPSGKEKLSITYRVRDDIEQQYKNRVLFEDIWKETANPEYYNRRRLNQLIGTQGVEKGTDLGGIEDVINLLVGAKLIAVVGVSFDEYQNKDINRIKFYKSTNFKDKVIAPEITENDLPF